MRIILMMHQYIFHFIKKFYRNSFTFYNSIAQYIFHFIKLTFITQFVN